MKIQFDSESYTNAMSKATRIMPLVRVCGLSRADLQMGVARYRVVGSQGNLYLIRFWERKSEFHSDCTCLAGHRGWICYHVAAAWFLHSSLVRHRVRPQFGSQWEKKIQSEMV